MSPSTMLRVGSALLAIALVAAGFACTTKGQVSDIVLTAALNATVGDGGTAGATCNCPAPITAGGTGSGGVSGATVGAPGLELCLQVENRLLSNATTGIRLNTNDFQIEEEHLTFTQVSGAPISLPAGETVLPLTGYVPTASSMTMGVVLVPTSVAPSIAPGSAVRVGVYLKGHLLDNSTVRSSGFEFLTLGCSGAGCTGTCQASTF